jgi:hypothetical protein
MSRKETVLKLLDSRYHTLVSEIIDYTDHWSDQFDKRLDIHVVRKITLSGITEEAITITNFLNTFELQIKLSYKLYSYTIPVVSDNGIPYSIGSNHRSQDILDVSNESLQYTTLVYEIANILTESQKS